MANRGSRAAPDSRAEWQLVERFRNGDENAFNQIFETYYPRLLGFLTRMCGHPEDARESLQDVFLAVFRYLKDFRGESSLKNWVFRIAVTACLKKKRSQTPHGDPVTESTGTSARASATFDPLYSLDQGNPENREWDPEKLTLDKEFRHAIVQGVSSMPYIYKIVLNLRDFEGFSTEEVAQFLSIKPATVKVRLHRARLHLQKWLKTHYPI